MSSEYKRLGIYAMYDNHGIVDDYIIYYLKEINKIVDCLSVVSNQELSEQMQDKIPADFIFIREDKGFDAAAFYNVCNHFLGWKEIHQYDEIIFMNDSTFGPFYPFQDMFDVMDQRKDLDFWGITKRGISDFYGLGAQTETVYPEHIQLYFYVVRKKMIQRECFMKFWSDLMPKLSTFRSAIINYEFAFTQYFQERGFQWDVYVPSPGYSTDNPTLNPSPYHYESYRMIKVGKCPLIKRKLFTGDFVDLDICDRSDLPNAFEYIQKYTGYDVDLIWQHILRIYALNEVIDGMHLYPILPYMLPAALLKFSGYGFINLGSMDFSEISEWIPSVDRDEIIRGQKDYILVIKLDERKYVPKVLNDSEKNRIIENLICNKNYLQQIMFRFHQNNKLGIIAAPVSSYGRNAYPYMNKWENRELANKYYRAYDLHIPMDNKKSPVHNANAFWCRKELLNDQILNDLENDSSGTMMQVISLIAQDKGYYTEILQSDRYASLLLANMKHIMGSIIQVSGIEENKMMSAVADQIRENKVAAFCEKYQSLYIYGAGEMAFRAACMLDKYCSYKGFIVTERIDNCTYLHGHEVKTLDEINWEQNNMGIMIAVGEKNNDQVVKLLQSKKIKEYVVF